MGVVLEARWFRQEKGKKKIKNKINKFDQKKKKEKKGEIEERKDAKNEYSR